MHQAAIVLGAHQPGRARRAQRISGGDGGSSTALSNDASIVATGRLRISARPDLVDLGGTLSGGSALLTAGNDIRFDTVKTGSTYQSQIRGIPKTTAASRTSLARSTSAATWR